MVKKINFWFKKCICKCKSYFNDLILYPKIKRLCDSFLLHNENVCFKFWRYLHDNFTLNSHYHYACRYFTFYLYEFIFVQIYLPKVKKSYFNNNIFIFCINKINIEEHLTFSNQILITIMHPDYILYFLLINISSQSIFMILGYFALTLLLLLLLIFFLWSLITIMFHMFYSWLYFYSHLNNYFSYFTP